MRPPSLGSRLTAAAVQRHERGIHGRWRSGQRCQTPWHDARMTRTAQYDHAALAKTLDGQLYVISRPQALACGLTAGALRHRTRPDGPWRALLPGVYLVDAREPNVPHRKAPAILYAGDGTTVGGIRFAPAPRPVADAALNLTASGDVRAIV